MFIVMLIFHISCIIHYNFIECIKMVEVRLKFGLPSGTSNKYHYLMLRPAHRYKQASMQAPTHTHTHTHTHCKQCSNQPHFPIVLAVSHPNQFLHSCSAAFFWLDTMFGLQTASRSISLCAETTKELQGMIVVISILIHAE